MREQMAEIKEILLQYGDKEVGNFLRGYDVDGGKIDVEEAIAQITKAIHQGIEKVENPYPNQYINDIGKTTYIVDKEQEAGRIGWAEAQQKILFLFTGVK